MIPTSESYQVAVQLPHTAAPRVRVFRDDIEYTALPIHSGSVDVDKYANIRRRFRCQVADPTGQLTPTGAKDLLTPLGTIFVIERGLILNTVDIRSGRFDTQDQWNTGTHNRTYATAGGDLTL